MSTQLVARAWFSIDLVAQNVFPLGDLPKHAPKRRGNKTLNKSTGFRWAKDGRKAADGSIVKLPTIRVAGSLCTSTEAFQAWCERLSVGGGEPASPRTTSARRRAVEAADRELEKLGA